MAAAAISAADARRDDDIHAIDPVKLLSPRRIDLVCKYLYFRELASSVDRGGVGDSIVERMYQKHIQHRTGGVEPPDPYHVGPEPAAKQSIGDYTGQARRLLASLEASGFDRAAAITYFTDGTLGNGAHRLSAALALNLPVFARAREGQGTAWPFRWFVENGFAPDELQRLLYTYVQLKTDDVVVFVLYSPAQRYWEQFGEVIAQRFYPVGHLDLTVDSPLAMYELIHDVYGTAQAVSATSAINRKALLLAMSPLTVRVVLAERHATGDDLYDVANLTKTQCRELAGDSVAPEVYLSAHASSSREETLNLAGVLLSANNLRQLRRRVSAGVRSQFGGWLMECRRSCAGASIAIDDICVVGSSPLEVVGVRASTDVDFTLRSKYRRARYGDDVTHLGPGVDIVTAGYHRRRSGPAIDDDELIDNPDWHFRYRGFKFANPEVVLEQKDFYRREKDVRDVEEAGRRLAVMDPVGFDPSLHLAACTEALLRQAMGSSSPSSRAADRQPLAATVKSVLRRVRRRLASAPRRD